MRPLGQRGRAVELVRRVALAVFFLALLADLPPMGARVFVRFERAAFALGEDARAARLRVLGAASAAAFDSARRLIPPDETYLLVDGGEDLQAAAYWARFELAPRRAVFLGRLSDTHGFSRGVAERTPGSSWVVIAEPAGPPRLLKEQDLRGLVAPQHGPG